MNVMSLKLHTVNITGNLHLAASTVNSWGWAEWLVAMHFAPNENTTIAVFKMPAAKVHELRAEWADDPHFDDYTGPADPYSGASATAQPVRRTRKPAATTETTIAHASEKPLYETTGKLPHDEAAQAEAERNEQFAAAGQLVDVDISHDHATHDAEVDAAIVEMRDEDNREIEANEAAEEFRPPAFITGGVASNFAAETNAAVAQENATTTEPAKAGRVGRPRKAQVTAMQGEATKHVETGTALPAWATLGLNEGGKE